MSTATVTAEDVALRDYKIWPVIGASAAGTVIEWYDFYIFGSLAAIVSPKFYPAGNDALALIAYLSTFAVGFIVRPFGAIFFGRIGDLVGRKYAFLVTLLIMGLGTAAIGFMPTYEQIGYLAPVLLLLIRVLQGLALGGEYGGAAIYVAEHVPDERRGFYTSFIQITATLGLFLSLITILVVQQVLGEEAFADWGWRLPFMLLDPAGRHVALHPAADEGVPDLQHPQVPRTDVEDADARRAREQGELEGDVALVVRCDGRPGGGLVHRPVLRTVLSADDPQDRAEDGQHRHRRRPRCWACRCSCSSVSCPTASVASGS